jgi:hypothetical protein
MGNNPLSWFNMILNKDKSPYSDKDDLISVSVCKGCKQNRDVGTPYLCPTCNCCGRTYEVAGTIKDGICDWCYRRCSKRNQR